MIVVKNWNSEEGSVVKCQSPFLLSWYCHPPFLETNANQCLSYPSRNLLCTHTVSTIKIEPYYTFFSTFNFAFFFLLSKSVFRCLLYSFKWTYSEILRILHLWQMHFYDIKWDFCPKPDTLWKTYVLFILLNKYSPLL